MKPLMQTEINGWKSKERIYDNKAGIHEEILYHDSVSLSDINNFHYT